MDELTEMWTRRRIEPSSAVMIIVTAAALVGATWLRYGSRPADVPLSLGARVPPLQVLDLATSEPLVLLGLNGKVLWVTFWSIDSASAPSSLQALERASKRLAGHRRFAQVAAAVPAGKAGQVRESLRSNRIGLPVYLASAATLRQFGVSSADPPFHVLIGADGRIIALARGGDDSTIARLAATAQRRLDELDPEGAARYAARVSVPPTFVARGHSALLQANARPTRDARGVRRHTPLPWRGEKLGLSVPVGRFRDAGFCWAR